MQLLAKLAAPFFAPYISSVAGDSLDRSINSGALVCIRYAISYDAMRVAISGSPVATRRLRFSSFTASTVARCVCGLMPLGLERLTIGSPVLRKGTPWKLVGRNPLAQLAAPPRGPRG